MNRFRHILASIGLSERSRHTARQAASMARSCEATLTLLHVLPARHHGRPAHDRHASALASLNDIAGELSTRGPVRVSVGEGDPRAEISRYALDQGVDLIVVGSRRRPSLERELLESVGEEVIRAGACSVLTVPDPDDGARQPPADHREILCALDLSEASTAVLEAAVRLARGRRAHLTVLHAIGLKRWYGRGDDDARRHQVTRSARERLSTMLAPHRGPGLDLDPLLCFGEADAEILRMASRLRAELLVVGAHSSRVGGSSLGPTANRVLHDAACPLLLVRTQTSLAGTESSAREDERVGQL
jgi:nucleotide-binding universal stress UspA family protein